MLLTLLGCAPLIVPWPPPADLPSGISELDHGQGELGAGWSEMTSFGAGVGLLPNWFGGSLHGDGRLGLGKGWDLGLDVSQQLLGPTAGVTAGKWYTLGPRFSAGPMFGVGSSFSQGAVSERLDTDEHGETVTYPAYEYSYLTAAPSVGGRMTWKPVPHVSVPALVRVAGSAVIPTLNVAWGHEALWLETAAGVRLDYGRVSFGIGPAFHFSLQDGGEWFYTDVTASAHVRFGKMERP
jgi:hypothetical protein